MPRADDPMVRARPHIRPDRLGEHIQLVPRPDIAVGKIEADNAVLQRGLLRHVGALAVQVSPTASLGLEQVFALGVVVHPDEDLTVQRQAHDRRVDGQSPRVVASPVHGVDDPCVPFVGTNVRRAFFSNERMVGKLLPEQPEDEGLRLGVHLGDNVAWALEGDLLCLIEPLSSELTGQLRRVSRHLKGRPAAGPNGDIHSPGLMANAYVVGASSSVLHLRSLSRQSLESEDLLSGLVENPFFVILVQEG